MYKKILSAVTAVLLFGSLQFASAETEPLTKEKEFTARDKTAVTEFEKEITENGQKYVLSDKKVKYNIVSETPDKKTVVKEVELGETFTKDLVAPNKTEQDGLTYNLKEIKYTDTIIKNRTTTETHEKTYGIMTYEPKPLSTVTIQYFDKETEKMITAELPLSEVVPTDEPAWYDDVKIPIKLTTYDTSYYMYNGVIIPANGDVNELTAVKSDILKSLKLDENIYKINRFEWDGEAYTEGEINCRNAIAYGERFARRYKAVYKKTFALPDANGYKATAIYTTETDDMENVTYQIKATAVYEKVRSKSMLPYIATGGGVVAVGVFLFLFALSKRNVVIKQNGKTIYKTRVSNNTVIIDKVRKNHSAIDISVTIKKSYTSRHIQENIKITDMGVVLKEVTISNGDDLIIDL